MSGMGSDLQANNPTMVAAFRAALIHQGIVIAVVLALLTVAWISLHEWLPAAGAGTAGPAGRSAEPAARRLLRIGFGILWTVDGLLQAQPAMPVALPSQVIQPAADGSPAWVQHLVNWAANAWSYHPITAAASAVWIQLGIGVWLLAAAHGTWSRLAGLASVGWGLVVWVFGEAFGGVFGDGLTWLFGAPGAAAFYCVAGAAIALPARAWSAPRLGRLILAGTGLFLAGMAVLQAWPGRGFWQGRLHGRPATLTGMIHDMAQTRQPATLSAWVSEFGSFVADHGFAVNLFVVVALAATGAVLISGSPRLLRPALAALVALCLADWVLIEDLGGFGGVGTDPNSMIPFALVVVAGYLALARVPAAATDSAPLGAQPGPVRGLRRSVAAASPRSVAAAGALAMTAIGALPMAAAAANPTADPIIARAIAGSSAPLNYQAPGFDLVDQHGKAVTLASMRGKVVLLTFLDDVCTSDCPLEAQEFKLAGEMLGQHAGRVELVAINLNPIYNSVAYIQAFDRQERLGTVPNWRYLTGTRAQLQRVWRAYGVASQVLPAGAMIGHSDVAFIIDQAGRMRRELNFDPGPGTSSTKSSFAAELAAAAENMLRS